MRQYARVWRDSEEVREWKNQYGGGHEAVPGLLWSSGFYFANDAQACTFNNLDRKGKRRKSVPTQAEVAKASDRVEE